MTTFLDLPQAKGADWLAAWVTLLTRLTAVTNALEGMAVTSSSSVEPATGELSFTTDQTATDRPLAAGATVRGKSAADPAKFFLGTVTSFSGTALVVEATLAGGAGAVTDWVIGYELAQALSDLTADLDHGDVWRSINVPTPTAPHHGAPRSYVDAEIAKARVWAAAWRA